MMLRMFEDKGGDSVTKDEVQVADVPDNGVKREEDDVVENDDGGGGGGGGGR